jgi:hypothetical protein
VGILVLALVTILLLAPDTVSRVFESIAGVNIALRTAAMLVLNALVLLLMYLRVRGRRVPVDGLIVQAQGALANVEVESARAIVLDAVNHVPGVISTEATIKAVRGQADIQMDVNIDSAAVNIPQKQKEINRVLRQVINKQLGLRLYGRPRVNIRLETPPVKTQASAASAPVITAAPAAPPALTPPAPAPVMVEPAADAPEADTPAPATSPSEGRESSLDDDWLTSYLQNDSDDVDKDSRKTEQG